MTDRQATRVMLFLGRIVTYGVVLALLVPISVMAVATTRMRGRR